MTTTTWASTPQVDTDTNFRAWGSGISTALAAIGLVKTSDTGQINWSTVAAPGATYTFPGYEMWRLNDSLQSTAPLFLRIEYGSSGANSNYPTLRIGIGKATDGAGTLTTYFTDVSGAVFLAGYTSSGVAATSYASHSGSGFAVHDALGSSTIGFGLERSLNSSGVATGNGFAFVYGNIWTVHAYTDPTVSAYGTSPVNLPGYFNGVPASQSSSLSKNGVAGPVIPIPFSCPGIPAWISKQFLACAPGDVGQFTASPHGTAHTYRSFNAFSYGSCGIQMIYSSSGSSVTPAALYWE